MANVIYYIRGKTRGKSLAEPQTISPDGDMYLLLTQSIGWLAAVTVAGCRHCCWLAFRHMYVRTCMAPETDSQTRVKQDWKGDLTGELSSLPLHACMHAEVDDRLGRRSMAAAFFDRGAHYAEIGTADAAQLVHCSEEKEEVEVEATQSMCGWERAKRRKL